MGLSPLAADSGVQRMGSIQREMCVTRGSALPPRTQAGTATRQAAGGLGQSERKTAQSISTTHPISFSRHCSNAMMVHLPIHFWTAAVVWLYCSPVSAFHLHGSHRAEYRRCVSQCFQMRCNWIPAVCCSCFSFIYQTIQAAAQQ